MEMPWEWEYNWWVVLIYAVVLYIFGVLTYMIGLPAVIPMVIGAVAGACAASWEWFEL